MAGFHKAGPNEALIISGGWDRPKIVVGGRAFVLPILQKVQVLSLEVMTLSVETPTVYTSQGVALSIDGVAQVKVAFSEEAVRTAAQQFLGKRLEEIKTIALQTLEGHQRSMLGTMTVEQVYKDREAFAGQVREVASTDMANMGLEIVSFTIKDIRDDQGYMDALGMGRTAEVKRDASIGKAEAERDAGIKSAEADQAQQAARFKADTAIADSERAFSVEKASYDREVNARKAESELAYQLQEAKTQQSIREEELQIEVVERQKQIEVQEQEIIRRERELDATIRRPADAERYRLETIAEGNKVRVVVEATAEAEAIKLRGEAEADAIRARGLAEAEAMRRKAEAWKEYGHAALVQQLFEGLPEIASAVAQPLAKTERIVVIGGGSGGSDGAGTSKITQDVANTIGQLPPLVEALTGIDIIASLRSLPGVKTVDALRPEPPKPKEATVEETPIEEAAIVEELSKEAATEEKPAEEVPLEEQPGEEAAPEEKQSEEGANTEVILAEEAAVLVGAAEEIPLDINRVEEGAPDEKPDEGGPWGRGKKANEMGRPNDDLALIDLLLANHDISEELQQALRGFMEDIAQDRLEEKDRKYLHDLAARLSAGQTNIPKTARRRTKRK